MNPLLPSFSVSFPLFLLHTKQKTPSHQPEHETPAPKPAELSAVENVQLTRPNLQQLMFEDVCAFRPECRSMAPGGGGGDPSPASTEFSDISINSPAVGVPQIVAAGGGREERGQGTSAVAAETKQAEGKSDSSDGDGDAKTVTAEKAKGTSACDAPASDGVDGVGGDGGAIEKSTPA